jgi:hypothetical protein
LKIKEHFFQKTASRASSRTLNPHPPAGMDDIVGLHLPRRARRKATVANLETRRYKKLKKNSRSRRGDRTIYRRMKKDYLDLSKHWSWLPEFRNIYREKYKGGKVTVSKRSRRNR